MVKQSIAGMVLVLLPSLVFALDGTWSTVSKSYEVIFFTIRDDYIWIGLRKGGVLRYNLHDNENVWYNEAAGISNKMQDKHS